MNGFVALHRSEDILALMERHPNAFLLLSLIAVRARWSEEACAITGLRQGQALIGDWRKAGIGSEMRYRTAKKRLESCGFITTKTTGKGTVATLTDKAPFSVSVERATGAVTGKQQASNRRVTTKNKERRKQGNKEEVFDLKIPHGRNLANSWNRWKTHRKEMQKPLTPTSEAAMIKKLATCSEADAVAMIEHTIENGWLGLRAPTTPSRSTPAKTYNIYGI